MISVLRHFLLYLFLDTYEILNVTLYEIHVPFSSIDVSFKQERNVNANTSGKIKGKTLECFFECKSFYILSFNYYTESCSVLV